MKSILSVVLIAGVALISGCCIEDPYQNVDNTRYVASDTFSYEVPAGNRYELEISAINGSVEVIAIPGAKTVRIWGEKSVASESDDDANEHLDDLNIKIIQDVDRLSVRTLQPENTHGRAYRINYLVRIPADWDATISMVNGEAYLDNLTGSTQLNLVNGNTVMRNLYGSLMVRLTNGGVDAEMTLAPGARCDLRTVNGRIELAVPRSTSAAAEASLTTGSISVNDLDMHNINRTRTTYRGVLGEGNGEITLQTVNGSIELRGE